MPVDEENGIIYTDLGCGNKNDSYGQQLLAAGFELDNEDSRPSQNAYFYAKTLASAQGVHGEKTAYVGMVYTAATDEALTLYPNGIWRVFFFVEQNPIVENVTLSEVNAEFASKKLFSDQNTSILPTLTIADGCTKIDFVDATSQFVQSMVSLGSLMGVNISFSYAYSAEVHFYYPEAGAEGAISTLANQLTAAGFTNAAEEGVTTDANTYTFAKNDGQSARIVVTLEKAMSEATQSTPAAYEGYINLSVSHYSMTYTM